MKKVLLLGCLMCLILTLSCSNNAMNKEYNRLPKDHIIEVLEPNTLVNKINNKETFVVVLGFPTCPWCQQLMPYYNEVAKELKINNVYYTYLKDMRDNDESTDRDNYLFLKEYASIALDIEKDRINAPTILVIKDGDLVGYHLNTVESHVLDESNTLPNLTKEQEAELRTILKDLLKKIS